MLGRRKWCSERVEFKELRQRALELRSKPELAQLESHPIPPKKEPKKSNSNTMKSVNAH